MEYPEFNLDELEQQQQDATAKKNLINSFGSVAKSFDAAPSAYDLLVKKTNQGSGNSGEMYDKAASAVQNPMDLAKQKYAMWEADQKAKLGKLDIQKRTNENALSDPSSTQSASFRKMIEAKFPDVVKSYGDGWAQVSAADQTNIFKPLELKEQIDARRENARILAAGRADARQSRQDEINSKKQDKIDEREQTLAVPGFARTGEVLPKAEEAMKFRKATAVADQMDKKLSRMKELVKKYGSYENGGDGGQEMESLATEIQLLGKSPELYELGVLAGPDLSLLEKITSDPSSIRSMFTRDSTRQTQIDSQIKSMRQKLDSTAKSLGYSKKENPGAPETKIVNGVEYTKVPGGWAPITATAKR